jgi:hypothetical protein
MKVILVCIGNFQEYIIDNIKNLQLFGNNDIIILTETKFFNFLKPYNVNLYDIKELEDYNFLANTRIDRNFRNGFWMYCSLRLFYLYSFIKKFNIINCIHLENDVLTYVNFDEIKDEFKLNKINVTFDCDNRVIPGIIFIPNYHIFTPIIANYNFSLNDMENLANVSDDIIEPLPIIPIINEINKVNKNFNKYIFDAAAIGQYLGGVDKRNEDHTNRNEHGDSRGFVNETCIIKYNNYKFFWIKKNNLYIPHISINNNFIKIINLHIHSKELYKFMADDPLEDKFIIKL